MIKKAKVYKCQFCDVTFDKFQAIGGHYSKTHPNQSASFKAKKDKRDSRVIDRQLLQLAKDRFTEENPDKNIKECRAKIAYLKLKLKKQL